MAHYRTPSVAPWTTVSVGSVTTTIVSTIAMAGYDEAVIYLDNDNLVEELNGSIQVAPTAAGPWTTLPDSSFEAMAVGSEPRVARVSGHYGFARVRGLFASTTGNVQTSAHLIKTTGREAP